MMMTNTSQTNNIKKTVVINHGISACGKTTISKKIINFCLENGLQASRHSTDDYFMTEDSTYIFDISMLGENHQKNQSAFRDDLEKGIDIVICDNTNLIPWQSEVYTTAAREYGYMIVFIDYRPRTLEKHLEAQIVSDERPDAHAIPAEALERMLVEYDTYRELLYKDAVVDTDRHAHYKWDDKVKQKVRMPEPSKKFDLDELIVLEAGPLELITIKALTRLIKIIKKSDS